MLKNDNKISRLYRYEKRRYRQRYRQIFWLGKPSFRSWAVHCMVETSIRARGSLRLSGAKLYPGDNLDRAPVSRARDGPQSSPQWEPRHRYAASPWQMDRSPDHLAKPRRRGYHQNQPAPRLPKFPSVGRHRTLRCWRRSPVDIEERLMSWAASVRAPQPHAAVSTGWARAKPRR